MNVSRIILDPENEVMIVKFALVGLFVASIGGLMIWEIMFNPYSEIKVNSVDGGTEAQSEFGKIKLYEQNQVGDFSSVQNPLTYVDNSLGFQISRPNEKWEFDSNIDDVLDSQTISNKKFLGGMYVKNSNEKSFFVAVFNLTQFDSFALDDYVMSQKTAISQKFDSKITIDDISSDGKWSIFGAEITLQNKTRAYGEQILEIHGNKLYMLQYSGAPPYLTLSQTKDEIRQVMDSFKPFS